MLSKTRYGLVILGLLLPLIVQAKPCTEQERKTAAPNVCDVTFTATPTFANMCIGTFQAGTYTIRNNTPVPLRINYIRIQDNDPLPGPASVLITSPSNNCGSSLAAGATCNILLHLQPLAFGTFNRVLQIGIDTRQVQLNGPVIGSVVNCTPAGPVIPGVTPGAPPPTIPATPASLFSASILAFSTITNTGPTVVNGDVDLSPGTSITGFPPGTIVNGTQHAADATAAAARADAITYYNALVAQPCGTNLTGMNLGGMVLAPGVYCFNSSAQLTGALVLAGPVGSNYTFQIGSTLTTASNSSVTLSGGVTSSNVNWAVGSSATLGTNTAFAGIIDAVTSITMTTGTSLNGRAWALNGAVTLDTNAVNPN